MAKDIFHRQVKAALIKSGWTITHDPYLMRITDVIKLQIDLGAENAIGAERDCEKIAVEIKSFISDSDINAFHTALGQYLNYSKGLSKQEPDRTLYLAVPLETYSDFFQLSFVQETIELYQMKLVVYEPNTEEIREWIN
jgi:XisH protein